MMIYQILALICRDLVAELHAVIHDALDQRKENVRIFNFTIFFRVSVVVVMASV